MGPQELIRKVAELGYTVRYDDQNDYRAYISLENSVHGPKCYLIICENYNHNYSIYEKTTGLDNKTYYKERINFDSSQQYIGFVDNENEVKQYQPAYGNWKSLPLRSEDNEIININNDGNTSDEDSASEYEEQEQASLAEEIKRKEVERAQQKELEKQQKIKEKIAEEEKQEIKNPKGWSNFSEFAKEIGKKYLEAEIKLPADTPSEMHKWRQTHGEQQFQVTANGVTLTFYQHKNQVRLNDYEFIFIPRGNTVDQLSQADKKGKKAYLVEQGADSEFPAKLVIFEKGVPKGIDVGYQFWTKPEVKKGLEEVKEEIKKEAKSDQKTNPICPLKGKFLELVRDYAVEHYKRELRVSFHIGLDPTKKESDQQKDKNDRIQRSINTFVDMIQQSPEFKDEKGNPIRNIDITVINPKDLRNQLMSALKAKGFAHITYEGKAWREDKLNSGNFQAYKLSGNRNTLLSSPSTCADEHKEELREQRAASPGAGAPAA